MIWPIKPANTGRGRCNIIRKSEGVKVKPKSNINKVRIGNTIKMVFINYVFLFYKITKII